MPATSLFRAVLIAGLIFAIIAGVAGFSLSDTLPPTLQDYLAQVEDEDILGGKTIFFLIAALVMPILLPISTIGLWKFKPWARTLYVLITVAFIPFYPVLGPVVMNGWEAMFNDIALMLDGILIAMMFTGEISQRFKPSTIEAGS
jgi:hypothetical protein